MHFRCESCDKKIKTKQEYDECNKLGHELIDYLDPEDHYTNNNKANQKDVRKDNKKLYDHTLQKISKLVISENNSDEVFAVVKKEKGIETFKVPSRRFRDWLCNEYLQSINSNEIKNGDFFKSVADTIYSHAKMNGAEIKKIYNRVAQLKDEIWYDLARDDGVVIKITGKGVEATKLDLNSPIFRKNQSLQSQVWPKRDDDKALDKLLDLLRIAHKDKLVFKLNLIALFLEAYPIPMIVIGGVAGSFKTTTTAFVKRIVDPTGQQKEDNVSNIPANIDDLILYLNNRYLGSFDNVSYISRERSDVFSRAITGNTNSKRKLYTNEDESILSFRRKIILNGIVPNLDYPDLQSRLIIYERDPVDEKSRLTEEQLNEKFEQLLPNVLGQIFLILHKAVFWHKSFKNDIKPKTRMSDFEVWGEVISRVIGYKENQFLDAYYEKLNEASISTQDYYPLVTILDNFMKERDSYEGSATELHGSLSNLADTLDIDIHSKFVRFPKASNKLRKHFQEIDSLLRTNGLIVTRSNWTSNDPKYTKNVTIFKITKQYSQMKLVSSLSSPCSPQA